MENTPLPCLLKTEYQGFAEARVQVVRALQEYMEAALQGLPSTPTVKSRLKDFPSFFKKYVKILKTMDPPPAARGAAFELTDLIGLRVICPFIEDLSMVEAVIKDRFHVTEVERKGSNYSFKEFGYESIHILVRIPEVILEKYGPCGSTIAEIQLRTILQDAWAEVEHELVYKAEFTPFDDVLKRKLAAVNASLSLADIIFQEIRVYERQLNRELAKRRNSFYQKIDDCTGQRLSPVCPPALPPSPEPPLAAGGKDIDNLLLNALYAHNRGDFPQAIDFYSRILELEPQDSIRSLIYKHRGMANFARSHYAEAVEDFSQALALDPKSYKAAYYRGVVYAVMEQYPQAIDDFTLSLGLHPYQPFCLYRRAQAYFHAGDYPKALADCDAALSMNRENPALLTFRSMVLGKLHM